MAGLAQKTGGARSTGAAADNDHIRIAHVRRIMRRIVQLSSSRRSGEFLSERNTNRFCAIRGTALDGFRKAILFKRNAANRDFSAFLRGEGRNGAHTCLLYT